jgi:hypothetical protein
MQQQQHQLAMAAAVHAGVACQGRAGAVFHAASGRGHECFGDAQRGRVGVAAAARPKGPAPKTPGYNVL